MAPPIPSFLSLNGTPDTRPPGPPTPESQLPPISHIPGTFEPVENSLTNSRGLPEQGENSPTENKVYPGNEVAQEMARLKDQGYIEAASGEGSGEPETDGYINPSGMGYSGEIQAAIAVLAKANIQTVFPGGMIPTPNQELDPAFLDLEEKWQTFLRVLEKTGRIGRSAEIAGVSKQRIATLRKKNPIFGKLYDKALKYRAEIFEDEAIRRAVEGVRKDIYYKGAICGSERIYSDSLLSKLMEGNMPEKYRLNHKIELEGKMAIATMILPATTSAEEWAAQNSGTIIDQKPEDEYA